MPAVLKPGASVDKVSDNHKVVVTNYGYIAEQEIKVGSAQTYFDAAFLPKKYP